MPKHTSLWACVLIGAVGLACLNPMTLAQQPAPPTVDVTNRQAKDKPRLDRDTRELADEYAELLLSLDDVTSNYYRYLQDYDDDVVIQYRPSLTTLRRQLDSMQFVRNEKLLAEQLRGHTEQLRKTETHIRDSKTIYPMRLYRLVQGFRRELTSLEDLLQDDILPRLEENNSFRQAIQAYVAAVLAEEREVSEEDEGMRVTFLKDSLLMTIDVAKMKAEAKKLAEQMRRQQSESRSRSRTVIVKPPVPDVKAPRPPEPPVIIYDGRAHGSGLSREFADTVEAVSRVPIKIANRYGSIEVVGWEDNVIAATWNIEIQGSSRAQERAFMDSAKLAIRHLLSGYVVAPVFGQPNEKSARFIQNELVVYVPVRCPVTIENTFGEIDASGLEAGVTTSTTYAATTLSEITGGVTATCSMAGLEVSGCEGPMKLKNSYSPITVEDCSGPMTVENAYTQVTVTDSEGKLHIKNSGAVTVSDHDGDLTIDNSLGAVEVTGLHGNLTATNRYQSITVRDIDGSVKLDGAYAMLDMSDVRGDAVAINKFGAVKAEGVSGPLRIINDNGSTSITLDDLLRGTSRITGSYGSIIVSVPESADLLVLANTNTAGSISTSLPMVVTTRNEQTEGILKLGRAVKDSLILNAKNGSIIINSGR